jgi:hypothetical protein
MRRELQRGDPAVKPATTRFAGSAIRLAPSGEEGDPNDKPFERSIFAARLEQAAPCGCRKCRSR